MQLSQFEQLPINQSEKEVAVINARLDFSSEIDSIRNIAF